VPEALDPIKTLETVLAEHGPLHEDDIAQRLRDSGVADPDTALDQVLDEMACPARQLVDERWVWLPTVLAGRVSGRTVRPSCSEPARRRRRDHGARPAVRIPARIANARSRIHRLLALAG
jgi:hypothetical protein